jgi:glycopeptide antibiotics resistance protein
VSDTVTSDRRVSPGRSSGHGWVVLATLGYLAVLLTLTFLPLDGIDPARPVDLRLVALRTIRFALKQGIASREFLVLVGNLLAFAPLGALIPLFLGRRSLLLVFVGALALSLGIETGQLAVSTVLGYAYRTADVDDVILNVLGATLGYVIFLGVGVVTRARRSGP